MANASNIKNDNSVLRINQEQFSTALAMLYTLDKIDEGAVITPALINTKVSYNHLRQLQSSLDESGLTNAVSFINWMSEWKISFPQLLGRIKETREIVANQVDALEVLTDTFSCIYNKRSYIEKLDARRDRYRTESGIGVESTSVLKQGTSLSSLGKHAKRNSELTKSICALTKRADRDEKFLNARYAIRRRGIFRNSRMKELSARGYSSEDIESFSDYLSSLDNYRSALNMVGPSVLDFVNNTTQDFAYILQMNPYLRTLGQMAAGVNPGEVDFEETRFVYSTIKTIFGIKDQRLTFEHLEKAVNMATTPRIYSMSDFKKRGKGFERKLPPVKQ